MSTPSPSRLLLTPPRLSPSPRRPLFDRSETAKSRGVLGVKWTILLLAVVASVSFIVGVIAAKRNAHAGAVPHVAPAPPPIPSSRGWGDETGMRDSIDEVYFHIEPFESGLNNERISLLKAAEVASRRNWTLVLPSYKDFHAVIFGDGGGGGVGGAEASGSASTAPVVVLPFSHFYDDAAFAEHAHSKGFKVVRSLPQSRFHACSKLLSLASTWPRALTSALLSAFAREYRVVCLPPHAVWHAIQGYDLPDLDWSANAVHAAGLRPSGLYREELEKMVEVAAAKFSSFSSSSRSSRLLPDFIAVHVRIEEDWRRVCAMGGNRKQDHWLKGDKSVCLVGEDEIAERVAKRRKGETTASSSSSSSPSSDSRPLAFIMSAAPTSQMPALCDPLTGALRCFTPDDIWLDPDAEKLPFKRTKLARSYVSFLFAKEATALFGNVHSTFSRELGDEMRARGKEAVFYNPECPEGDDWCP